MAMTKGVDGLMRWWSNGRSMRLCLGSWICDVVVCGSLRFVGFTCVSMGRLWVWNVAWPINCKPVFSSKLPVFQPISIFSWLKHRPFPARQGTYTFPCKSFNLTVFSKVVISLWRVQAQQLSFPDLPVWATHSVLRAFIVIPCWVVSIWPVCLWVRDTFPFFTILAYFEIIIPFFGIKVSTVCTLSKIVYSLVIQSWHVRFLLVLRAVFKRIIWPTSSVFPFWVITDVAATPLASVPIDFSFSIEIIPTWPSFPISISSSPSRITPPFWFWHCWGRTPPCWASRVRVVRPVRPTWTRLKVHQFCLVAHFPSSWSILTSPACVLPRGRASEWKIRYLSPDMDGHVCYLNFSWNLVYYVEKSEMQTLLQVAARRLACPTSLLQIFLLVSCHFPDVYLTFAFLFSFDELNCWKITIFVRYWPSPCRLRVYAPYKMDIAAGERVTFYPICILPTIESPLLIGFAIFG